MGVVLSQIPLVSNTLSHHLVCAPHFARLRGLQNLKLVQNKAVSGRIASIIIISFSFHVVCISTPKVADYLLTKCNAPIEQKGLFEVNFHSFHFTSQLTVDITTNCKIVKGKMVVSCWTSDKL